MPRTALAATTVENDGVLFAGVAPDAPMGNDFPNNGRQFLVVNNVDVNPHTATFEAYPQGNTPDGLVVADKVVTIGSGEQKIIGPFPPSIYSTAANKVNVDWDSAIGMSVQAFSFAADPG